ncbi:HAD family hydrolase [Frateuria aurantia]
MHDEMAERPQAEAEQARIILFDFDGVLIHGDAFSLLVRHFYARSWWRRALVICSSPLLGVTAVLSRRRAIHGLIRFGLLGLDAERYRQAARMFAGELVRRPGLFCREGLAMLRRHQANGDRVLVVTGCEEHLVNGILEELGLTGLKVLASQLRPAWLGMTTLRHNFSGAKVESLAAQGIQRSALAYTDSLHDVPMLKLADAAVVVNGTPQLCKKIEKALGRSIVRVVWR